MRADDIPRVTAIALPTALQLEPSRSAHEWLWCDKYDETFDRMVAEYRSGRFPQQPWKVVPAARLVRIWSAAAKTGMVRDVKGLDAIAEVIIDNIVRLYINTEIAGHTARDPAEFLQSYNIVDDGERDRFIDWAVDTEDGAWQLSDYGFPRLTDLAAQIHEADTAEAMLVYIDMALNVSHERSDLASWFVQGGTATLNAIARGDERSGRVEAPGPEIAAEAIVRKNDVGRAAVRGPAGRAKGMTEDDAARRAAAVGIEVSVFPYYPRSGGGHGWVIKHVGAAAAIETSEVPSATSDLARAAAFRWLQRHPEAAMAGIDAAVSDTSVDQNQAPKL